MVGGEMCYAFGYWPNNFVGDIVDMLMQMLEVEFLLIVVLLFIFKGTWIYSRSEYCPSSEHPSPFYWSFRYKDLLISWFLQDAFHDNFVVQWHPESLRTMKVSISRPRVYLIDFETAVQFPEGCPLFERVSVGFPVAEKYARPHAPELASGKAYCPFKLDVWQLGYSLLKFKVWRCIFFLCYSLCLLTFRFSEHYSLNWWSWGCSVYD